MTVRPIDITPTPRILRVLGDIPFEPWQCIAELADNSFDAFNLAKSQGILIDEPRIDVTWSNRRESARKRQLVVEDNGPGMSLEELQNAARAGFSSNEPISSLGLFGMGFNIATANLGDETTFLSSKKGDAKWRGIKINFDALIREGRFSAPVITLDKEDRNASGTRIAVSKLNDEIFQKISSGGGKGKIRKVLGSVYSPILGKQEVSLYLNGDKVESRPHCVWGKSRSVVRGRGRGRERVYAVQEIDKDLGETYFDISRNRYLSEDECDEVEMALRESGSDALPENIVRRSMRLKGWVGIQRFSDTNDFGLDFIRNGRKILRTNKSLFSYENPETGKTELEYPLELGTTVGGRIVGEIHVDYLIPTYQKNSFIEGGKAWQLTVKEIRGAGPMRLRTRKAMGYDGENRSPLGLLVSAYQRVDAGTRFLAVKNSTAVDWAKRFFNGEEEYRSDAKWFEAAQEADRVKIEEEEEEPTVNPGGTPSDDPESYLSSAVTSEQEEQDESDDIRMRDSTRNSLINNSKKEATLSGRYSYSEVPGMEVTAWRVSSGEIWADNDRLPAVVFPDGANIDFFFDPSHHLLSEYPISPMQLLLFSLAERFAVRDTGVSAPRVFYSLLARHLQDERINSSSLQERSVAIMDSIRRQLPALLGHRIGDCRDIIRSSLSGQEDLVSKLLDENPDLLDAYQNADQDAGDSLNEILAFVSDRLILDFVKSFPEDLFDGKLFNRPYSSLSGLPEETIARLKSQAQDRVVGYLTDVSLFLSASKQTKYEMIRVSNTLSILEDLVT